MITSMGIYGFLSSAYQETANASSMVDKEIALINNRIETFQKQKDIKSESLSRIEERITQLNEGINNIEYSWVDRDGAGDQRELLSTQLEISNSDYIRLTNDISDLDSNILTLQNDRFDVEIDSDIAAELGPLKYISEITGKPMAQIVNILLLIIIFVFDPLAISLVLAANRSFELAFNKPSSSNNVTETTSNKNVTEAVHNEIFEKTKEIEVDVNDLPDKDQKENKKPTMKKQKIHRSGGYWF
jgi:hypothetical protein